MAIDPDYKFFAEITPTAHEKAEWARMAQDAYAKNYNSIGHMYSGAASIRSEARIRLAYYDALQTGYRVWLVDGWQKAAPYIHQHVVA